MHSQTSTCTLTQESHRQGLPGWGRHLGSSRVPVVAPLLSSCFCPGPNSLLSSQQLVGGRLLKRKLAPVTVLHRMTHSSPHQDE